VKLAIMQPYFLPYIGYFQLINAVDQFVILDDVNYITRGWINRNNILLNGKAHLVSVPLNKASQNHLICETKLNFSLQDKAKLLKTIQSAYKKSPYFKSFYPVFEEIILYEENDLTKYLINSLVKTLEYLQINKKLIRSSEIEKNNLLKSQDKIIEICKALNTTIYVNLSGGRGLYNHSDFEKNNIELKFVDTFFDKIIYKQYDNDFIGNLSILDLLMFNKKEDIRNMLNQYSIGNG
jgi:hypothetical protein